MPAKSGPSTARDRSDRELQALGPIKCDRASPLDAGSIVRGGTIGVLVPSSVARRFRSLVGDQSMLIGELFADQVGGAVGHAQKGLVCLAGRLVLRRCTERASDDRIVPKSSRVCVAGSLAKIC